MNVHTKYLTQSSKKIFDSGHCNLNRVKYCSKSADVFQRIFLVDNSEKLELKDEMKNLDLGLSHMYLKF